MEQNKLYVQISEKDLLCVNGCGFYGNPQWQGYCSQCWRNYHHQRQHHNNQHDDIPPFDSSISESTPSAAAAAAPASITIGSPSNNNNNKASWGGLGFDKFLEKKNQQMNRKTSTFRSFLRKSPSTDYTALSNSSLVDVTTTAASTTTSNRHSPSPHHYAKHPPQQPRPFVKRQLSNESQTARSNFLTFLHKNLPKAVQHDVINQTTEVVKKILEHSQRDHMPVDEVSELVQDAYQTIANRLRRSPAMKDCETSLSQILEEVETYICNRCYNMLFCPITDEEVEDLSLQDRIRSLHWVTYGFLQTSLDFTNTVVKDRIDAAVTEINDINSSETTTNSPSRRNPQRKLESILQCSKLIFEALRESRGAPASADEFLPALIYVILRSNPPQLKSNTTFVSRFALPTKLMSGEAGYYFTNLCCALQFVQNLNADSLTMPREEFEAYTSGQLMPPLPSSTCRASQAVKCLENSLDQLRQLNVRQERLNKSIDELEREENEGWDNIAEKIRKFREEHPPGKTLDVAWLESSPDKEELLPPPLLPTVAANGAGGGSTTSVGDCVNSEESASSSAIEKQSEIVIK